MKWRRALSAVLALAMIPSLAVLNRGKKVEAAGGHDIFLGVQTNIYKSSQMLDHRYGQEELTVMGGTVSLSQYVAEDGDFVTVTATPNPGFSVKKVSWGDGEADVVLDSAPYEFKMWDEDAVVSVIFEDDAIDYYAAVVWEAKDGAEGEMDAVILDTQEEAEAFVLPDSEFKAQAGTCFLYWNKGDGEIFYNPGDPCMLGPGTTIFQARYAAAGKAVFNPGKGSGNMNPRIVYLEEMDDGWALPECEFTAPEDMKFYAWECAGTLYSPGDSYDLPLGTTTFRAVFIAENPRCYVVAVGELNVRASASLSAPRIGGFTLGKAFESIDTEVIDGEEWVSLNYQGQIGWVMRKYLRLTVSVETAIAPEKYKIVGAGAVNVRSTPEELNNPSNRIGGVKNEDEVTVTGKTVGEDGKDWLAIDYTDNSGVHHAGWIMEKYTAGQLDMEDNGTKSLKINFSLPTDKLLSAKVAIAGVAVADLSEEQLENKDDGLLKALIYPADAYNFRELTKANITLPDGIGMEIMDMILQEDGSIAVTLCPENAVSVAFHGATAEDVFTKYISSGNLIAQPADPVKEGETFEGWYEDEACTIKFDFSKPVTGDVSLFSNFVKNEATTTEAQENTEENKAEDPAVSDSDATVVPQEITYTAVSDADSWSKGSLKGITVTVKRNVDDAELCFASFRGVTIDGKALAADKDYSAKKGSTIVTIFPATLEGLSEGQHTISFEFVDGKTELKISIAPIEAAANKTDAESTPTPTPANTENKSKAPKTGDVASKSRNVIIIVLGVVAFAAIGAVLVLNRKKDEKDKNQVEDGADPDQK